MQKEIDFVVLWVDGNDKAWQEKKKRYTPQEKADDSAARYRDWDILRYWFRSVERYAPWVNRIHFISDDQIPPWLNTEHPKLHLVSHRDYIPSEALPLFNSCAIEIGIMNIPGLAEQFVLFNDDFFLNAPISPEYYFVDGIPVDMAGITRRGRVNTTFQHIMQNNYAVINRHFDKRSVIRENFFKWYLPLYGKTFLRTLLCGNGREFTGFVIPHLSIPYRTTDFTRVWEQDHDLLAETQTHRFRCGSDLCHFVFRFWRLCVGDFYPRKSKGKYISLQDMTSVSKIEKLLNHEKCPEICINDNWEGPGFENAKEHIQKAFERKYPEKSSFER